MKGQVTTPDPLSLPNPPGSGSGRDPWSTPFWSVSGLWATLCLFSVPVVVWRSPEEPGPVAPRSFGPVFLRSPEDAVALRLLIFSSFRSLFL